MLPDLNCASLLLKLASRGSSAATTQADLPQAVICARALHLLLLIWGLPKCGQQKWRCFCNMNAIAHAPANMGTKEVS